MQPTKLKLLPTILSFAIVGLLAATVPYPGLQPILPAMNSQTR
jgi:hypothetical protein